MNNYLPDALDFRMGPQEQNRFLLASTLPLFVVVSLVIQLALELAFGFHTPRFPEDDETWFRFYQVLTNATSSAAVISLPALIFVGISRPTYAVGSWCAVVAGAGIGLAILGAAYEVLPHIFYDPYDQDIYDWHTRWAASATYYLALMAAGYAFLAYRGLNVVITERDGETVFEEPDPNLVVDTWAGDEEPADSDDKTLA